MCGILFVSRRDGKPAAKQALKRYSKQKSRGQQGFGVVAFDSKVKVYKRFMFENQMQQAVQGLSASNILLHHRYPTSVLNLPDTAHPIKVTHEELDNVYYVTHNGHISNHSELKDGHEKLGYSYTTEVETRYVTRSKKQWWGESDYNDSEALAIELARTIEGKQDAVKAKGPIAYIVLQVKNGKPVALYYGTNGGNPLTLKQDEKFLAIASEGYDPLAANKSWRLDFATDSISEYSIDIPPMYTKTYRPINTGSLLGFNTNPTTEEYMSTYALEEELEELRDEQIAAALELQTLREIGDTEGEALILDEIERISRDIRRYEKELEDAIMSIT